MKEASISLQSAPGIAHWLPSFSWPRALYSAASSLLFWVLCFFRTISLHLRCSTRGVSSHWILGALVMGFLPPLFTGFLTTYWWASSFLDRLNSLWILLVLLGPRRQGCIHQPSNVLFTLFHYDQVQDTQVCINDATTNGFALYLSSSSGAIAGMALAEQKADTSVRQDTFTEKPLSLPPLIPTTYPFHSSPRESARTFVAIHFS